MKHSPSGSDSLPAAVPPSPLPRGVQKLIAVIVEGLQEDVRHRLRRNRSPGSEGMASPDRCWQRHGSDFTHCSTEPRPEELT